MYKTKIASMEYSPYFIFALLFNFAFAKEEIYVYSRHNQRTIHSFYVSYSAHSFIHCNALCAMDRVCEAVSYSTTTHECRFSVASSINSKSVVFAQDKVFAKKVCGPPPEISHTTVSIDGRYIGVRASYTCTTPDGTTFDSECLEDETWTTVGLLGCPGTIGGSNCCQVDTDCLTENSLCIGNVCHCSYAAIYNGLTSSCDLECNVNANSYTKTPETSLISYEHDERESLDIHVLMDITTCKLKCNDVGISCASFQHDLHGRCALFKVTYQQVHKADPSAIQRAQWVDLFSRNC